MVFACLPCESKVTEEELQQAQDSLWSTLDVPHVCWAAGDGSRISFLWRQHQRAIRAKRAELQSHMRQLGAVLPRLVENGKRVIAGLRRNEIAVHDTFPELVRCLHTLSRRWIHTQAPKQPYPALNASLKLQRT